MPKDPTIAEAKAHKRARSASRLPSSPMTLGNMRENGIRRLFVSCDCCHHSVELNVDDMPDDIEAPSIGPRMVCTRCGHVGADARPDRSELSTAAEGKAGAGATARGSAAGRRKSVLAALPLLGPCRRRDTRGSYCPPDMLPGSSDRHGCLASCVRLRATKRSDRHSGKGTVSDRASNRPVYVCSA
jgi:hypothetical protein